MLRQLPRGRARTKETRERREINPELLAEIAMLRRLATADRRVRDVQVELHGALEVRRGVRRLHRAVGDGEHGLRVEVDTLLMWLPMLDARSCDSAVCIAVARHALALDCLARPPVAQRNSVDGLQHRLKQVQCARQLATFPHRMRHAVCACKHRGCLPVVELKPTACAVVKKHGSSLQVGIEICKIFEHFAPSKCLTPSKRPASRLDDAKCQLQYLRATLGRVERRSTEPSPTFSGGERSTETSWRCSGVARGDSKDDSPHVNR